MVLWTNYSKDGAAWLRKDLPRSKAEKERRCTAAISQQSALTDSAAAMGQQPGPEPLRLTHSMTLNKMISYYSTPSAAADGYEPTTAIPPPPLIAQGASVGHVPRGYLPQPGDVMYSTSAHHAIYDTFPGGDYVRAKKSPVDLTAPFTVEEALVSPIVDKKKKGLRPTFSSGCNSSTPRRHCLVDELLQRRQGVVEERPATLESRERERERERGGGQRL